MDCLKRSEFVGRVAWLGSVPVNASDIRAKPADQIRLSFDGAEGELHSGATRPACIRVKMLHEKGTEIRNARQLSILSQEENAQIAAEIGLEQLKPEWLGASMVLSGIPDWSHIPPGSRIQFPDLSTLVIDLENAPCVFPGKEIEADVPGHGKLFKPAAKGRRGVTAYVERPGTVSVGDAIALFVPAQRPWQPG